MKKIYIIIVLAIALAGCTKESLCEPEPKTFQTTTELLNFDGSPAWISKKAIRKNGDIVYVYTYLLTQ